MVVVISCFVSLLFLRMNFKQRVKYISLGPMVLASILILSTNNAAIKEIIDRSLRGFSLTSDVDRKFLRKAALLKFSGYNWFQKFFGDGMVSIYVSQNETLPHNFFLELLLSFGIMGVFIYIVSFLRILMMALFKSGYYNKFFCLQAVMMFFLTAFFQPFFTTSFVCGFLVYVTLGTILFDASKDIHTIHQ